jgi:hypothetical protein
MLVSILQGKFNGVFDLAGLRLPCAYVQSTQESDMKLTLLPLVLTKTDCRHESSSVEGDRCCCRHVDSQDSSRIFDEHHTLMMDFITSPTAIFV